MGEDATQAERFQHPSSDARQEKPSSPSPMPSSTPSLSLNLGCPEEAIRDNSQVNAVTVHTLLDKLVTMLDAVQENQHKMEQRQVGLEGSVKGIQSDLAKLSKYQASTSSTVGKLLEKSRKVSAHTRAVRERMERQSVQVRRLESNHAQLLRRNHFKVLIFQEEHEIPASVFVKEPASGAAEAEGERRSLEATLHSVDLSSSEDEAARDEQVAEDAAAEKTEESRAEKLKRSSLRKVDSLKKAFSRQNIEKKMTKLGTKIVSAERREKMKKSLASNHPKTPPGGKSSPFKVSPLTFGRKKVREGESGTEREAALEEEGEGQGEGQGEGEGPGEGEGSPTEGLAWPEAERAPRRGSASLSSTEDEGNLVLAPEAPEAPEAALQPGRSA
ncbi:serum deprivation-response protein [Heterocephalus glaber]|uniref:Serum deprivation-response protein n=1 Tax=Heterocephalus glaber TaxID=10181 RepID=A0AAX6Q894_HETGA|nr:serum deprivation-response protein [Heterocephalus glaber]